MKLRFRLTVFALLLCCIPAILFAKKNPTIKISANKVFPMEIGDSVTITWVTKNVKHLYCKEIGEKELPLSGSVKVGPRTNTNYLFIAKRGRKEKRKELRVIVTYPVFDDVNIPDEISDEETLSINWDILYADFIKFDGFDDEFPANGKIPLKISNDTVIKIIATNRFGYEKEYAKKVKVKYVELFSYPQRVPKNSAANISWSYKNTDSIEFVGYNNGLPPQGELYIPMKEFSKFRVNIYRKDCTYEVKDFSIQVYNSKIKYFNGNKSFFKGDEIIIKWEVEDADSVKLSCSNKPQELKGYFKYKPEGDELITLTTYLSGLQDQRSFLTHIINRKYISGETDYSNLKRNIRLDYEIFATDLSEFPDIVKLYVLVVDSAGNFVHGLAPPIISEKETKKYFLGLVETYYGGRNNPITDFSVEEFVSNEVDPKNISMILDYSGSMLEPIGALEYAAKSFINNKHKEDYLNIIKFDDHIENLNNLTKENDVINNHYFKPQGLKGFGGGTALYAAIGEGVYNLKDTDRAKEIIVFTDGYENSSFFVEGAKAVSALQIAEMAKESGIKINCISFGDEVNKNLLEVLAAYTGGKYFDVHSDKEITGVWSELPYLSANYYIVSFKTQSVDNLNGIKLTYNNNIGQNITTGKDIYTELPDDLIETKRDTTSYWYKYDSLFNNKTPLTLPQAIGFFSFNGSILMEDYVKNVDLLVETMQKDSSLDVVIFGHTDLVDTDTYHLDLSARRCIWVKDFIMSKGIAENRIIIIPLGEKHPVHKIEDKAWQAQENRRIEALLVR